MTDEPAEPTSAGGRVHREASTDPRGDDDAAETDSGRPLRVLIVTGIFPPDVGGPATYVPEVAEWLARRGDRVVVVTLADDRGAPGDGDRPYRVVRIARGRFLPARWAAVARRVWRHGRDADLLFVNGLATESCLVNLVLRRPLVHKVVADEAWERSRRRGWTDDGFEDFQVRRQGFLAGLHKRVRSWVLRKADTVIVPSRHLADWVSRQGVPEERIERIPNAVSIPDGIASTVPPLKTDFTAVFAGRLVPDKHVDQILVAVSRLDRVGLLVVGDGPERTRLERQVESLSLAERVRFIGDCSRHETLSRIAGSDLLVLASSHEGLPHAILEAMALGVPVVATAVGGIPEIVEDGVNGRLVPPRSPGALREAIGELAADPGLRRRLAEGGRRTLEELPDRQAMLDRTEAVLRRAATGRRVAAP